MSLSEVRHAAALAAVSLLTSGAVGLTAAAAPAAAADSTLRVIQHNLKKEPSALEAVAQQAAATTGPEVLFVQEACASMFPRLQQLGTVAFHVRRTNQSDCNDGRIGEAVVYTQPGAAATPFNDVNFDIPGQDQNYGMACLNFTHEGRVTLACSTHLAAGRGADRDALRLASTRTIRGWTDTWVTQTDLVVVGGDFNDDPTTQTLNPMYGVGANATGQYREIAQMAGTGSTARSGKDTFWAHKYDYVFATQADTRSQGGKEMVQDTSSDHRMLYGPVPLG